MSTMGESSGGTELRRGKINRLTRAEIEWLFIPPGGTVILSRTSRRTRAIDGASRGRGDLAHTYQLLS